MNWDAVGAVGQVLGSIAVFITLGYLAVQVRHAGNEVRRSIRQSRAEAYRDLQAQFRDPRIHALQVKANAALGAQPHGFVLEVMERTGLTLEEANLLLRMQGAWWNSHLQVIPDADELSAMERTAFDGTLRATYGSPGIARIFFETGIKRTQHPDAVRYVENLLAQPG